MLTPDDIKNKIGLAPRESRVYHALLKIGSGFASKIAAEAGVKRSTTYQLLEGLHKKGLVLKYTHGKKFFYSPAEPKAVLNYLDEQEQKIQKQKLEFQEIMPEMKLFYEQSEKKPKLSFFDKKQEVENLILECLKQKGENEVIGFISLDNLENNLAESFFNKLASAIKKEQTKIKFINYDDNPDTQEKTELWLTRYFSKLDKNLKPQIKILKSHTDLSNIILITGAKTYLIDISPPEFMGTEILNHDLAESFRIMFESLWERI